MFVYHRDESDEGDEIDPRQHALTEFELLRGGYHSKDELDEKVNVQRYVGDLPRVVAVVV